MNTTKPGLPNYTGPNEGVALWVHHGQPVEYCTSFTDRIAYIIANKPPEEQALRLTALTYIGTDPRIEAFATARKACATARDASDTAWDVYATARDASDTAWDAYDTVRKAYATARQAFATARQACATAGQAIPWREIAARYAPEVPYLDNGTLDFETFNTGNGA